jgi:hypothetical protein
VPTDKGPWSALHSQQKEGLYGSSQKNDSDDQPRVPAGSPEGGEFGSGAGAGGGPDKAAVSARKAWNARPGRESLSKRLGPKISNAIRARDKHQCVYCHATKESSRRHLHLDHVVPKHAGGPDHPKNLVLACHDCNTRKKDLSLAAWKAKSGLAFRPAAILARVAKPLTFT